MNARKWQQTLTIMTINAKHYGANNVSIKK